MQALAPVNLFPQQKEIEVVIPRYGFGDNSLSVRLGLGIPLFLLSDQLISSSDGSMSRVMPPNLTLMGNAALNWNTYIDDSLTVGLEVGGGIAVDITDNLLYVVPIIVRGSYVINTAQMEIPIMLGLGTMLMRLVDKTSVLFTLQPGASFLWRVTNDWSFGVTGEYWFTWEPRWGSENSDPHMFGNFFSTSATVVYHF